MKKKEPRTRAEWITLTERLISKHTDRNKRKVLVKTRDGQGLHSFMKDYKWLHDLADEVVKELPTEGQYDPNMRAGYVMAWVLTSWVVRLHHAKINDAARPLKVRRDVYKSWLEVQQSLFQAMVDERDDGVWGGQKWNDPWLPNARGGKFV